MPPRIILPMHRHNERSKCSQLYKQKKLLLYLLITDNSLRKFVLYWNGMTTDEEQRVSNEVGVYNRSKTNKRKSSNANVFRSEKTRKRSINRTQGSNPSMDSGFGRKQNNLLENHNKTGTNICCRTVIIESFVISNFCSPFCLLLTPPQLYQVPILQMDKIPPHC